MSKDWTRIESETIDWLRPVMAFMVICLHVQMFYVDEHWSMSGGVFSVFVIYLCKILCTVAVPTFFFISGFLFFRGLQDWDTDIWKHKVKKRLRTLLVPFLLWNVIALIAFPLTRLGGSILKGAPMDNVWAVIQDRGFLRLFWDRTLFDGMAYETTNLFGWRIPSGQPMDTPLWFVRDLMVVILFTPCIHWLIKKTGACFIALLAILFVLDIWIPASGFGIKATFFFAWGSFFSVKDKHFVESFCKMKIPDTLLLVVGLVFIPFLWDKSGQLFSMAVRVFIIIEMVFFFNLVSCLIKKGKTKVNRRLANSSFFVYCAHMIIIASAVMWAIMSIPFHTGFMRSFLFVVGAVLIFLICHFLSILLERYCPSISAVLTGGRNNKKIDS